MTSGEIGKMNYLNPGSFIPNMDFSKNPLQGAVAGQQLSAMQQLLSRSYRDSDLDYQKQQDQMSLDEAERPTKMAEFASRKAKAQEEQEVIDSGMSMDSKKTDLATKKAQLEAEQLKSRLMKFEDQGDYMTQVADEYNGNPYQAVRDGPRWQQTRKEAKEHGIDLPDNPDPDFFQAMFQKAQSYQQTRPKLIAKKMELDAEYKRAMDVARETTQRSLGVAKIGADSRAEVQDLKTQAAKDKADQSKKLEEMAVKTLERIAKQGGPKPGDEIEVQQALSVLTDKRLEKDTGFAIEALRNRMDPDALDKLRARAAQSVAKDYGLGPKSAKDQITDLKRSLNKVPSESLAGKVGKAGEEVETEKGTYVWDDKRHGWAKKK